jgi:hypothetical protein
MSRPHIQVPPRARQGGGYRFSAGRPQRAELLTPTQTFSRLVPQEAPHIGAVSLSMPTYVPPPSHDAVDASPQQATFKSVSTIMQEIYNNEASANSMALDILSVYLKGQKILYIEAKSYCEVRLNALMLPAIVISAATTVLGVQLDSYLYGGVIVASLAAVNSCILSLISYLKLDAKAEAHKTAAYKFDKLQSLCEFQSGKVLYFHSEAQEVADVLEHIETQVKEIKEVNQFVLPEQIRRRYPVIYSTNVFSLVKMLQTEEMILTNRLKSAVNAARTGRLGSTAGHLGRRLGPTDEDFDTTQKYAAELEAAQNEALEKVILFRKQYYQIDADFKAEIRGDTANVSSTWLCCPKKTVHTRDVSSGPDDTYTA